MNTHVASPENPAVSRPTTLWSRIRLWLPELVILALLALVGFAIRAVLREVSYDDVVEAVRATPRMQIFYALLATAASYVTLMGYDVSALRYIGAKVSARTLALASFCGYALGNTVGMGALTGGAVRLRVYGSAGLDTAQIGRLIGFIISAFGLGISFVGAVGLLWGAHEVSSVVHLPAVALEIIAGTIVFATLAFIALCAGSRELALPGFKLRLPKAQLALFQLLISAADILFAGAVLWLLMPPTQQGFVTFIAFYSIALALGVISHVPGGLGVFEATLMLAYGSRAPMEQIAGALVLYRVIYFVLPLALAMLLMAFHEMRAGVGARVGRAAAQLSPMFLSVFTLIVGSMLLISGVTPFTDEATELLSLHVPLQVVEASHFLGSIAGLMLLFVARGLLNRLDAAWWAAVLLAVLSFILALPKGIAVTEMSVIAFQVLALLAGRKAFDRRASLLAQPLSQGWLLLVTAVIAASAWLFFFVYQDIDYNDELWWQFAFDAHAPRSLRATLAVVVLALGYAAWQAFRPAQGRVSVPARDLIAKASAVIQAQPNSDACLALMGDKDFMFSASGRSFIMYGKRSRTWVSLYDPVGPREEHEELVWRFVELAAEHGGRPAFYQVGADDLSLYVDAGLRPLKLGEEACVLLKDFSTKGSSRQHLRTAINKGEREGLTLEVIPPAEVWRLVPDLQRISNDWLDSHNTREKSFSLGSFSPDYLKSLPLALVRKAGVPVAFANIGCTGLKQEVRIDLMRYSRDAPKGTMDYLFVKLILHYQAEGYAAVALGMAPFSGLADHRLAPRWHRLGRLIFSHGEHFYNFQGLRKFKEKFDPVWEPRYLCAPGGLNTLLALLDIAQLTSGSFKGVFGK